MYNSNVSRRRLLTCLLFWFAAWPTLTGQGFDGARASLRMLTLEDGLPNREVHSIARDTNGVLWLGAGTNLVRYDGYRFEPMAGLEQEFLGAYTRGWGGLLYAPHPTYADSVEIFDPYRQISSGCKLGRGSGEHFQFIPQVTDSPLLFLRGDTIFHLNYIGHGGDRPDKSRFALFPLHLLPSPLAKDDRIFFADTSQFMVHDPTHHRVRVHDSGDYRELDLPPGARVTALKKMTGGRIWCLTDKGAYMTEPNPQTFRKAEVTGLPEGPLNFIKEDSQGHLLVGHVNPFLLRAQSLVLLSDGLCHDLSWLTAREDRIITAFGEDFTRSLDFGTYGGVELLHFRSAGARNLKKYMYTANLPKSKFGHVMRGFTSDDFGNVYANKDSKMNAWYRLRRGSERVDTIPIVGADGEVVDQFGCGTNLVNFNGYLYGHSCHRSPDSTRAHLYRFDPVSEKWAITYFPEIDQVIRYIVPDKSHNRLWLLTQEASEQALGYIYTYDLETERIERVDITGGAPGLEGYARDALLDHRRSVLWVGTTSALYKYNLASRHLSRFVFRGSRPTRISDVHLLPDNTLLLGTLGAGLYHFDPADTVFTWRGGVVKQGAVPLGNDFIALPSNSIADIAATSGGGLILTTFNGLVYTNERKVNTFTVWEGLPDNEFNTSSLHYDTLSERWFAGGINGFVSFTEDELLSRPSPYRPLLLRHRRLDEDVGREETFPLVASPKEPLVIPASVAYFSLEFTIPDYNTGKERTYQTRLDGLDPGWRSSVTAPAVRYTRLPAGSYEFHLRGTDVNGYATREMTPLKIIVLSPWYERPWFYLTAFLLGGLIVGLIVRARFRHLRERYETARKVQTLELRTLRQQMNPHFISNAMNAIREYVYHKDPDRAAGYLTDFSRLMRLFLEASRSPMMTVAHEIALIDHYVRLEQLRFPGKFNYRLTVDEAVDPEMDEVPSFLLQPIVENAINHGLRTVTSGGLLTIDFKLDESDDEALILQITDNGIGRAAAARHHKEGDHTSHATQILKDREALLAGDKNILFKMETTDLYPGANRPGTKVTIIIATKTVS